jgi:hypothetical protein
MMTFVFLLQFIGMGPLTGRRSLLLSEMVEQEHSVHNGGNDHSIQRFGRTDGHQPKIKRLLRPFAGMVNVRGLKWQLLLSHVAMFNVEDVG